MVGMVLAMIGTAIFALAGTQHSIALGYGVVSLGFGLFRPGVAAGTSLSVSRQEQGEAAGITVSISGAAFILAPFFALAPDAAGRKAIAEEIQVRALRLGTHYPLGEWFSASAVSTRTSGWLRPPSASVFWGVEKTGR